MHNRGCSTPQKQPRENTDERVFAMLVNPTLLLGCIECVLYPNWKWKASETTGGSAHNLLSVLVPLLNRKILLVFCSYPMLPVLVSRWVRHINHSRRGPTHSYIIYTRTMNIIMHTHTDALTLSHCVVNLLCHLTPHQREQALLQQSDISIWKSYNVACGCIKGL